MRTSPVTQPFRLAPSPAKKNMDVQFSEWTTVRISDQTTFVTVSFALVEKNDGECDVQAKWRERSDRTLRPVSMAILSFSGGGAS